MNTNIKQSQKLIKLGLEPRTADKHFREWKRMTESIRTSYDGRGSEDDMPSWSTDALFNLMPECFHVSAYLTYELRMRKYTSTEKQMTYVVEYVDPQDIAGPLQVKKSTVSLLDSAYKMMCWLLENKKI